MINFLDCTLRDGGYYNNWDFSLDLVRDYLNAMKSTGFNWVELGFRSKIDSGFKGPFAFSSDSFLSGIDLPEGLGYAVMVNASELLSEEENLRKKVDNLFSDKSDSPISLVRIACHYEEFEKSLPVTKILSDKGYLVGMNLMQISQRSDEEILTLVELAKDWPIEVFYIADSLGSLDAVRTSEIINLIAQNWNADIGVHCHDNLGKSMQNSLAAMDSGASWIDSTVTGMGRGPGNLQSEYVVSDLMIDHTNLSDILPIQTLIDNHFKGLKDKFGWGRNALYSLSGALSIHPTFVQEMISNPNYNNAEILTLMERLGRGGGEKFSRELLDANIDSFAPPELTNWFPREEIASEEILLIAPGPSIHKYSSEIEKYIDNQRPFVISLNLHDTISESKIDVRVISHPLRAITELQSISQDMTIISPMSEVQGQDISKAGKFKIFSSNISGTSFSFSEDHSSIPNNLAISYALGICGASKVNRVLMAGFDGFASDDPRRLDVDRSLKFFGENPSSPELLSITPTLYDLPTSSVFLLNSEN